MQTKNHQYFTRFVGGLLLLTVGIKTAKIIHKVGDDFIKYLTKKDQPQITDTSPNYGPRLPETIYIPNEIYPDLSKPEKEILEI